MPAFFEFSPASYHCSVQRVSSVSQELVHLWDAKHLKGMQPHSQLNLCLMSPSIHHQQAVFIPAMYMMMFIHH